jgi:TatA/E family protein of Tat protein translocase
MFSVPDILVLGVVGLLLFGPDRLPKVMRQAGRFMREVQNTSQSFVAEMERAADAHERPAAVPPWREPELHDRGEESPAQQDAAPEDQPQLPLGEAATDLDSGESR